MDRINSHWSEGSKDWINVVCLESNDDTDAVCGALAAFGYNLKVIDLQRWLSSGADDCTVTSLLSFTAHNLPDQKYASAIAKRLALSPHIALYSYPLSQELQTMLLSFQECCRWPCEPQELALHLQRISSKKSNILEQVLDGIKATDWLTLNLVGDSQTFKNTLLVVTKSAGCDAPILIEGETGSGKEVVARAVHYLSSRRDYPFIPLNCGAIPDHLIENELFGHEKGAYTDARQNYAGLIVQAEGGTLFLDEIEALSLKGQVSLLRFLEDKKIKPLGGKKSFAVNVRVIAASNSPLSDLVVQKSFRQDLLFRLNLLSIKLPPLRDRSTDIQHLAEYFLQKYRKQYQRFNKRLHPITIEWMNHYYWPGNVRELENFIHRGVLLSEDNWIRHSSESVTSDQANGQCSPGEIALTCESDSSYRDAKYIVLHDFEASYLTGLMSRTNGNVTLAANLAQKERRALGKLLKKHAIDPAHYRATRQV